MIITLSPQASNETTIVSVNGDFLTVDGVDYNFSTLPNNSQVEGELPAVGTIKKIDSVVHVTLLYKYDSTLSENSQSTNADDYIFDVVAGEVPSPIILKPDGGEDVQN